MNFDVDNDDEDDDEASVFLYTNDFIYTNLQCLYIPRILTLAELWIKSPFHRRFY